MLRPGSPVLFARFLGVIPVNKKEIDRVSPSKNGLMGKLTNPAHLSSP